MKKALLILVVLFVALAVSCASTGGGGSSTSSRSAASSTPAASGFPVDLSGTVMKLAEDNPGNGNYLIKFTKLMTGFRVRAGETYKLSFTYSVNRDLTAYKEMSFNIVDTTEAAGWWNELCDTFSLKEGFNINVGQEYSGEIVYNTKKQASGSSGAANALVFIIDGPGKLGPIELTFKKFIFEKVE